jgi:ankyrin repeat protein
MAERTQDNVGEDGNTPFHVAAASLTIGIRGLESISSLGIDINQPNRQGRTPLHVLCSIDWHEDLALPTSLKGHLAYFMQRSRDVNVKDNDGATPLHLASTASEFLVKELLAFGADASAETDEGLTALHLAVRARQSNIVGMLTAALSRRYGHESLNTYVDAKDRLGRSPLYHACRSGRPESVALLLATGADPSLRNDDGMTLVDACAEFEEEQALWANFRRPTAESLNELVRRNRSTTFEAAAGIKLQDVLRPFVVEGASLTKFQYVGKLPTDSIRNDQDTTRIDEILEMLLDATVERVQSIEWISNALSRSMERCELRGYS